MRRAALAVALAIAVAACGGRHRPEDGARGEGARAAPAPAEREAEGARTERRPAGERGGGARDEPRPRPGEGPEAPDDPEERGVPPEGDRPRIPASPEALLAPGAVGELQRALASRGHLEGRHREGELDSPTSAAIRRFQEEEGLAATGVPDRETLSRLGLDPARAYGRDGER